MDPSVVLQPGREILGSDKTAISVAEAGAHYLALLIGKHETGDGACTYVWFVR
jgi:hypothetical protein